MKVIEMLDKFPKFSETFILREILALQKKGIEIEVFAFYSPDEDIVHPEVQEIKKIIYLQNSPLLGKIYGHVYWFCMKPLRYIKTAVISFNRENEIRELFRDNLKNVITIYQRRPDHIHAHWEKGSNFAMMVSLLTGIPFTFTTHHHEIFLEPEKNYRIKSKLAKKHFTVAEYNRQYIMKNFGVPEDEIAVVRSALDFKKVYPVADSMGKNTIISIARLKKIKGIDILIQACAILKKENIPFECLIVGDGIERKKLEELIKELDLIEEIKMVGYKTQEEVIRLLASAKVFALASRSDSLGNVFTEARACRVPVIGPNVKGVPEVINDGIDGFLVEPENIDELASKLKILLTNESLRKEFIEKGYKKAFEQFNIDHETEKLVEIWKK